MSSTVDETLRRAMSAIQSDRPNDALRLVQEILSKNPSQPNALHLHGYALLMLERAGEAIGPLEKAFRSLRDPAVEISTCNRIAKSRSHGRCAQQACPRNQTKAAISCRDL